MTRANQTEAILALLLRAQGGWVPLTMILQAQGPGTVIAQYNARIYELRKTGQVIENMTKRSDNGGKVHSWFRIPLPDSQLRML